jgi:hypothetical protein
LQCGQMAGWLRWQVTAPDVSSWMPDAVVWCPVAKGQQLLVKLPPPEHLFKEAPSGSDPTPPQLQPHPLGAWRDVWVDPNSRAVGTQPVSRYLVKSAALDQISSARRVLLLSLRARDSGFSMVHGRQPRSVAGPGWSDGAGGLAALEHIWQALWSHQCARLRVHARSGRRRVEAASPAVPAAAGAGTTGRFHPLERAAPRRRSSAPSEAFADSYDALLVGVAAEVAAPQPPWRLAYQAFHPCKANLRLIL